MGQLITTVVGGVVGFLIGGPMGAAIGMSLGGMVGATLFGPTIKGPRLNDLKVTSSTYGIVIPEIYGTVRIQGNMIWTTGIKETKNTRRAGKGGPKVTTYTYDATFAVALCKGPINRVLRIWADSKLIYDGGNNASRNPVPFATGATGPILVSVPANKKQKKSKLSFRVYKGDEEQLPDSLIEADKGVGNVSAHRGIAYVVFERMQLEDFGNRIPQLTFEVSKTNPDSFPSVELKAGPGGTPTFFNDRVWYPDWENGRLFTSTIGDDAPGTDVYDLSSMRLMKKVGPMYMWPGVRRHTFAPYANIFIADFPAANSRPLEIYDLSTGALIRTIGLSSRSLPGYYVESGPRQGQLALAANFDNQAAITKDGKIIVLAGSFRNNWILTTTGQPLGWYDSAWVPRRLLPALGGVWGWRNGNNGVQIADFLSGGVGRTGREVDRFGNVFWTPGGGLASNTTLRPFPSETYSARVLLFDETDGCFFSLGTSTLGGVSTSVAFKYNPVTGAYKFIRKHPGLELPRSDMQWSRLAGGTFGWVFAEFQRVGKAYQIDLQTGELIRDTPYGPLWGSQIYFGREQHWDDVTSSLVGQTQFNYRRIFFNGTVSEVRLSDVVRDIATKAGVLTEEDIDTSNLVNETIIGFAIDRQSSARDALKLLATGHMFDAYESDYKLKFRTRGSDSVVTITEDWLVRSGTEEALKQTLIQELEMPLKVTVNYYDTERDHQQGSQSSRRYAGPFPTMWTAKEDIVDLPIVWTPNMAKRSADKLLKMAWANRMGLQFGLPWRFLRYDPTDVATLNITDAAYLIRLTEVRIGQDFSIEADSVTEKSAAYISTKVGAPSVTPIQEIGGGYPATPVVMNTPLLRDEDYSTDGSSICYITASSLGFSFSGAAIYVDDGIEPSLVGNVEKDTVTGIVINALPNTTAYESTDEKTVLRVSLGNPEDELESVTQLDMLNFDVNSAFVGNEVIQFRDAVQQENGEWWLTGIRRARRGTNYAVNGHEVGERFVLLDPEAVTLFERPPDSYVTTREFRAVTDGQDYADAVGVFEELQPRDLMPYTPEDLKITDDGTNVVITIQRRSRVTAPLRDGTGSIHFKEGAKQTARIVGKFWPGLGLDSAETTTPPAFIESVPVFDASGNDLELVLSFPLSMLGGRNTFLARLSESGVVDGIPKWVAFERVSQGRWNWAEFY